jgi:flagellar hook-length control protein FliK
VDQDRGTFARPATLGRRPVSRSPAVAKANADANANADRPHGVESVASATLAGQLLESPEDEKPATDTAVAARTAARDRAPASTRFDLDRQPVTLMGAANRSDARHGGNRATGLPADGNPNWHVDNVRFVQRVARAIQLGHERGGDVQLRLSPPELGRMQLEVAFKDGVLTAHLETETMAAKNLVLENLHLLRDRLAQQDIKIERFLVDVMEQSSGDAAGQLARDAQERGPENQSRWHGTTARNQKEVQPHVQRARRMVDDTQLNVII